MGSTSDPTNQGVSLRPMTPADLEAAYGLTSDQRWPHRPAEWEQALRLGEGLVAERDGQVVGTALRWRWGPDHATIGLVVVSPACQGRRIGNRLMSTLLGDLPANTRVLLHATAAGRGLYERLGFVRTGEIRQHQGTAQPCAPVALPAGWRLRPGGHNDLSRLIALDATARGMPRERLITELLDSAESTVVLDNDAHAAGFAMLRRFGRGHVIGPVVAPDANGAKALISHLASLNAGKFTRIDIDFATGLGEWLEEHGLLRVDAPTTMVRGAPLVADGEARLFAIVTQALG